ncbi:HAD family hydrolase [Cellulomonas sp. JH27-2]|uniref:HAD family hydrolase n=1 Tax=Cellulomonas sp. JH27-2 TaxID=2774139 RepID=UPI00351ABEFA
MSLPPVDGVLFDIDDTLVATREAFAHALSLVARQYLPDVPPERADELVLAWRADVNDQYGAYTRGETTYRAQRMARANDLHAAFGGPVLDDDAYEAWDAVFDTGFRDAWVAHDDASAVVDELLAAGLVVGALSNAATAYQVAKLERAGLGDRVPMLVGVDTLGFGKPDPRAFAEACRRLGTEPARTAYVGDDVVLDAIASRDAGLVGIWLDRPGDRRIPVSHDQAAAVQARITSLDELPGLLRISA